MTVSANWDGMGTLVTSDSAYRSSGDADTDLAADWTVGAPSLGATNP